MEHCRWCSFRWHSTTIVLDQHALSLAEAYQRLLACDSFIPQSHVPSRSSCDIVSVSYNDPTSMTSLSSPPNDSRIVHLLACVNSGHVRLSIWPHCNRTRRHGVIATGWRSISRVPWAMRKGRQRPGPERTMRQQCHALAPNHRTWRQIEPSATVLPRPPLWTITLQWFTTASQQTQHREQHCREAQYQADNTCQIPGRILAFISNLTRATSCDVSWPAPCNNALPV